jgi:hypothetical protein
MQKGLSRIIVQASQEKQRNEFGLRLFAKTSERRSLPKNGIPETIVSRVAEHIPDRATKTNADLPLPQTAPAAESAKFRKCGVAHDGKAAKGEAVCHSCVRVRLARGNGKISGGAGDFGNPLIKPATGARKMLNRFTCDFLQL